MRRQKLSGERGWGINNQIVRLGRRHRFTLTAQTTNDPVGHPLCGATFAGKITFFSWAVSGQQEQVADTEIRGGDVPRILRVLEGCHDVATCDDVDRTPLFGNHRPEETLMGCLAQG